MHKMVDKKQVNRHMTKDNNTKDGGHKTSQNTHDKGQQYKRWSTQNKSIDT